MARDISNIDVVAVLQEVLINFQRIRQEAPRCLMSALYLITEKKSVFERSPQRMNVTFCRSLHNFFQYLETFVDVAKIIQY